MKLSEIKVNSLAIESGAWVKNIPEMGELELLVRGSENRIARDLKSKLMRAVPQGARVDGLIPAEIMDRIDAQVAAEAVLIDWKGISDEQGQPIPFSKAKALEILLNPDLQAFNFAVTFASRMVATMKAAADEAIVGNSSSSSNGA